jgi:hypothetical protein
MSADEARALAMAYELEQLLSTLVEGRDHPRIDAALDLMDGVIDELDEIGLPDHGKQTPHTLRLLVTEPRAYEQHRTASALRHLASAPWRRP